MPNVLNYTNAFPGIPFPNNKTGQNRCLNYLFQSPLQPRMPRPLVLSWTMPFPNINFPQHLSGQATVFSYIFPGAVQPTAPTLLMGQILL